MTRVNAVTIANFSPFQFDDRNELDQGESRYGGVIPVKVSTMANDSRW